MSVHCTCNLFSETESVEGLMGSAGQEKVKGPDAAVRLGSTGFQTMQRRGPAGGWDYLVPHSVCVQGGNVSPAFYAQVPMLC